jgi:hypothetical protein
MDSYSILYEIVGLEWEIFARWKKQMLAEGYMV